MAPLTRACFWAWLTLLHAGYSAGANSAASSCSGFHRGAERFSFAGLPSSPRLAIAPMSEALNAKFPQGAVVSVTIHDIICDASATGCCDITVFVRSQTSDINVMWQLYADNEYGFLTALDWKPRLVLDAGANVGLAARLFAALWPNATIVSLEPDLSNFAMLELNAALAKNILPQQAGLWDKSTYLDVHESPNHTGAWGMQVSESASSTNASIRAVSLSSLRASLGISTAFDILKIDIEGAEATVFQDREMLKALPAVPLVSVEVHDRYQASASKVVADAFSELDFNRSRSGEYLVFTNNAVRQDPRQPVVTRRAHLGVLPVKTPCNISLGSLAVIVDLAFGVWFVMSIVVKGR